jgi:hypothetical protein
MTRLVSVRVPQGPPPERWFARLLRRLRAAWRACR